MMPATTLAGFVSMTSGSLLRSASVNFNVFLTWVFVVSATLRFCLAVLATDP